MKNTDFSPHSMKCFGYSPQKSKYPLCIVTHFSYTGFIQASLCKIQGLLIKDSPMIHKDYKFMNNTDVQI